MLTPSQLENIKSGKIRDKKMMQMRIRQNLGDTIQDINTVIRYHSWIEGQNDIENFVDDKVMAELVANLLFLLDNDKIGEDIIWMLVNSANDCWTVPGSDHVHGKKQEFAIQVFLECFSDFDDEDPMQPEPEDIEGWDELVTLIKDIDN